MLTWGILQRYSFMQPAVNLLVLFQIVELREESHHPGHAVSESSSVVAFAEEPELGQGKATGCREEVPHMAGLQYSLDPKRQISLSPAASQLHEAVLGSSASCSAFALP